MENNAILVLDEIIKKFETLGNLPIGARAVVLILKHYKDKIKED